MTEQPPRPSKAARGCTAVVFYGIPLALLLTGIALFPLQTVAVAAVVGVLVAIYR